MMWLTMDPTIIAVVGTLLGGAIGAIIGIFAGPVRDCFAHRREIKHIRKAIYNELYLSCRKLRDAFSEFGADITEAKRTKNNDKLRSINKRYYSGPITFSVYHAFRVKPIDFYQLEEADKLDEAYFRLTIIKNGVNQYSHTRSDDPDKANKKYDPCHKQFLGAIHGSGVVNVAFEANAHVLEKIDGGALLKKWRKFSSESMTVEEKLLLKNAEKRPVEKKSIRDRFRRKKQAP